MHYLSTEIYQRQERNGQERHAVTYQDTVADADAGAVTYRVFGVSGDPGDPGYRSYNTYAGYLSGRYGNTGTRYTDTGS